MEGIMTARKRLLTTAALLALAACSDLAGVPADGVKVQAEPDGVVIENRGSETIFYLVMDVSIAPLILWGPCVRPGCPTLAPGATIRLDSEDVLGWGHSDTLSAYWWQRVPGSEGTFEADSIRTIRLDY
jgi:hypothetical protein